jgi:ParB-like chromosome segregation protein Spo0J
MKIRVKDLNCKIKSMEYRDIKHICKSIGEIGILIPLVINAENYILDGVHRFYAAISLGIKEVPVVFAEGGCVDLNVIFLKGIMDGLKI